MTDQQTQATKVAAQGDREIVTERVFAHRASACSRPSRTPS
jgi:hypothetical protein